MLFVNDISIELGKKKERKGRVVGHIARNRLSQNLGLINSKDCICKHSVEGPGEFGAED